MGRHGIRSTGDIYGVFSVGIEVSVVISRRVTDKGKQLRKDWVILHVLTLEVKVGNLTLVTGTATEV